MSSNITTLEEYFAQYEINSVLYFYASREDNRGREQFSFLTDPSM